LNRVCREFRLNDTELKQKVEQMRQGTTASAAGGGEVRAGGEKSAGVWVVELAWPAGNCSEAGSRQGLPSGELPRLRLVLERFLISAPYALSNPFADRPLEL